jgi:hypothetical protein
MVIAGCIIFLLTRLHQGCPHFRNEYRGAPSATTPLAHSAPAADEITSLNPLQDSTATTLTDESEVQVCQRPVTILGYDFPVPESFARFKFDAPRVGFTCLAVHSAIPRRSASSW